jgi:hypothetical protein
MLFVVFQVLTTRPQSEQSLPGKLGIYNMKNILVVTYFLWGRAIAQAVSRWLPCAAVRARAQVRSCGICGEQSDAGADFLRVLWFPLPVFIPPIAPQSQSSIIWSWCNRPVVAGVPIGLSLTPLIIIIIILNSFAVVYVSPYACM